MVCISFMQLLCALRVFRDFSHSPFLRHVRNGSKGIAWGNIGHMVSQLVHYATRATPVYLFTNGYQVGLEYDLFKLHIQEVYGELPVAQGFSFSQKDLA